MQMLFLTSRLPYPPDRGDRLRTYQFLRLFALEHDVVLVSFVTSKQERLFADELTAFCREMYLISLSPWRTAANEILNAWRDIPLQTLYYRSRQMEKTVENLLSSKSFDVAYVHLFRMAPYLANHPRIYRILDLTDLISYEIQSSMPYQTFAWRSLYQIEGPRIARYEKRIASRFNEVWFISKRDHDLFMENGPKVNSWVVPHSIGEEFSALIQDYVDPLTLLFIGHLEVKHNIDAIRYMAEKIMPLILQEVPNVEFLIVGAGDKKKVIPLENLPGVRVLGYVPDLKIVFRQSAIAVAPLRFSAGVQTKVVESMAAGLPVVTSSDVSAGLGTLSERDLLVADEAEDFASQTLRLIRDEDLRKDLGRAGRAYARAHFSAHLAADRLKAIGDKIKD